MPSNAGAQGDWPMVHVPPTCTILVPYHLPSIFDHLMLYSATAVADIFDGRRKYF